MADRIRHLISPVGGSEHAFCGLAFDAFGSGDHETDDEFADGRLGLRVTCPDCCTAVAEIRQALRGVRFVATEAKDADHG